MPRRRNRPVQGESQQAPDPQPQIQEEKGRVTKMASSRIAYKDMTDAQKQVAFEKFTEKQESGRGRNSAKRKAATALKASHIDEYNVLVTKFAKEEGVTMPSGSTDEDE